MRGDKRKTARAAVRRRDPDIGCSCRPSEERAALAPPTVFGGQACVCAMHWVSFIHASVTDVEAIESGLDCFAVLRVLLWLHENTASPIYISIVRAISVRGNPHSLFWWLTWLRYLYGCIDRQLGGGSCEVCGARALTTAPPLSGTAELSV